jgi:hypothetical protein
MAARPNRKPGVIPRKPMAKARRVSLFEREIRIGLSSAAIEILMELGSLLSEGQIEDDLYFGSTMMTIDLARAGALVSDTCDIATAHAVAELVAGDKRVSDRARQVGQREAERLAATELADVQIDVRVTHSGSHLQLDMDVEASVAAAAQEIS